MLELLAELPCLTGRCCVRLNVLHHLVAGPGGDATGKVQDRRAPEDCGGQELVSTKP